MKSLKSPAAKTPRPFAAVDHQRRTCLVLDGNVDPYQLIQLNTEEGLDVINMPAATFSQRFHALADYPAERAARLYAGYARLIGATETAMQALQRLTTVTEEDIAMATAKKTAAPVAAKTTRKTPPAAGNEKAALAASLRTGTRAKDLPANGQAKERPTRAANPVAGKKPVAAKPVAKKTAPAQVVAKTDTKAKAPAAGRSAADAFRELIRAGKLTDDAIFAKVQAEFQLDDKKRGYVSWYRNDLRKKGEKVPDAKK